MFKMDKIGKKKQGLHMWVQKLHCMSLIFSKNSKLKRDHKSIKNTLIATPALLVWVTHSEINKLSKFKVSILSLSQMTNFRIFQT